MIAWWIANAIFAFAVIPGEIFLLNRTLNPIQEIRGHIDSILENGVIITGHLDGVTEILAETKDVVSQVAVGALRYGGGLDRVIGVLGRG